MTKVLKKYRIDSETPGTIKYSELKEDGQPLDNNRQGAIPMIYVQKSFLNGARPSELTLTIEY